MIQDNNLFKWQVLKHLKEMSDDDKTIFFSISRLKELSNLPYSVYI